MDEPLKPCPQEETDAEPVALTLGQLNPEAGMHAVPDTPNEFRVAVIAGERTLAHFPYVLARFGERGARFTHSDSAWLTAITQLPPEDCGQQIFWLGRILGSRGLPRVILEVHLQHLYEALVSTNPEDAPRYVALTVTSMRLRDRRLAWVDQQRAHALAVAFQRAVPDAERQAFPNTGDIIISAVCDAHDGIDLSIEALLPWLTDPRRFSTAWIDAVERLVASTQLFANTRLAEDGKP